MPRSIGVLIVDREPLFRRGLAGFLSGSQGVCVLDSVGTAEDAFRRTDAVLPTVALVGTTLPDAPGITAAAELRRRFPALAVVVIADDANDDEFFAAIRAGTYAYLPKDVVERDLLAVVKRAAAGEYVINEQLLVNPAVAARVIDTFRDAAGDLTPARAYAPLTDREVQILQGAAHGQTNAQIGSDLGISGQTVKNHITSILRKLAVNDRTQAVVLALRRGWLNADTPPPPDDHLAGDPSAPFEDPESAPDRPDMLDHVDDAPPVAAGRAATDPDPALTREHAAEHGNGTPATHLPD